MKKKENDLKMTKIIEIDNQKLEVGEFGLDLDFEWGLLRNNLNSVYGLFKNDKCITPI